MTKKSIIYIAFTFLFCLQALAESSVATISLLGEEFYCYTASTKESLYAISKKYNLPLDSLQKWNPNVNGEVRKGEKLFWPASITSSDDKKKQQGTEIITYDVRYGDIFPNIASKFNTTVEKIFELNPNLTPHNLNAGIALKIEKNSIDSLRKPVVLEKDRISGFKTIIVGKNESWEGIARSNNIALDLLKQVNADISQLRRNQLLTIPTVETISITEYKYTPDSREFTDAGIEKIYNEIYESRKPQQQVVTVVLSNPTSNKDIDFSRGFLYALSKLHPQQKKLDVRFIKGEKPDSLISNKNIEEANTIVATFEKDFPLSLASMGSNDKMILNVFDVKNESLTRYPGVNNLLQSSEVFNENASKAIINKFGDAQFIFLGDPLKASDGIAASLMSTLPMDHFEVMENLENAVVPYSGDFVIYSFANKKEEISSHLKMIEKFIEANSDHDNIAVIGRPAWIMHTASMNESMHKANVYFPSRFYLDDDSDDVKQFNSGYKAMWGKSPVKSYPLYAAMGFDTANWLLSQKDGLQIQFNLIEGAGGGKTNNTCYLVHLGNNGFIEKISLEK